MIQPDDELAFSRELAQIIEAFRRVEVPLRAQYDNQVDHDEDGKQKARDVLERTTRRFVIDRLLKAFGWDPDNPIAVVEEARGWAENGDRLYFDYLGLSPETRSPVLLVEAKGFDAKYPENQAKDGDFPISTSALLAATLTAMKTSDDATSARAASQRFQVSGQWTKWLTSLREYVRSLGEQGTRSLARLVITSGDWLILFEAPLNAFSGLERVEPKQIHCFRDFAAMNEGRANLLGLLRRQDLVDALPLTMSLSEAVDMIRASSISAWCRGVVVATKPTGAERLPYPTRTAYAAVVLWSGTRPFAVTDYRHRLHEPDEYQEADKYPEFLAAFERNARTLEGQFWLAMRTEPKEISTLEAVAKFWVRPTPAQQGMARSSMRFVFEAGESIAPEEFLVLTGDAFHYKRATPLARLCDFHDFYVAKDQGKSAVNAQVAYSITSFTTHPNTHHCEQQNHRMDRKARCEVSPLETHLCCKTCVFDAICWQADRPVHACPEPLDAEGS